MARPMKYTLDELENMLDDYFSDRLDTDKKVNFCSIRDLCNFLDIDTQTLYRWENKPGYSDIVKKARNKIIAVWEQQLMLPGRNTTGAIFYLKNFGDMADRVEHKHTGQVEHKHSAKLDDLPDQQLERLTEALDMIENTVDITPDDEEIEE